MPNIETYESNGVRYTIRRRRAGHEIQAVNPQTGEGWRSDPPFRGVMAARHALAYHLLDEADLRANPHLAPPAS